MDVFILLHLICYLTFFYHFRFFFQMHSPMCTHPCALTVSLLMTPANFTAKTIGFGLTAQWNYQFRKFPSIYCPKVWKLFNYHVLLTQLSFFLLLEIASFFDLYHLSVSNVEFYFLEVFVHFYVDPSWSTWFMSYFVSCFQSLVLQSALIHL